MAIIIHLVLFSLYIIDILSLNAPVITQTPQNYFPRYGTLELSCQADGDPMPDISWYDDQTKLKIISSIAINGIESPVQIMKTGKLSRLIITEPDPQHEYRVYCNASNSLGSAISPVVNTSLAYLNMDFLTNPPPEKEVYSGFQVVLTCRPPEGRPFPTVSWFKDSQPIDSETNARVTITTQSEFRSYLSILKIANANLDDSGVYHCLAKTPHSSVKSKTSILKISRYPNFHKITHDVKFIVSSNAKIQCPIDSAGTVHWTRLDGEVIDAGRASIEGYYLRINNIQMSDSGRYVCETKPSSGQSIEGLINVIVQSPATFIQTPEDKSVLEGDDVTFKCVVSGYPLPSVYWETPVVSALFPDDSGFPRYRVNKDGSLHIENTQLTDAGKYTCNGHSSLDAKHSSAHLYVKKRELAYYPVISLPPQNQTLLEGSTATFRCEVVSHMDATIKWYRGLQNELLQVGDRISLPTRGALQIKKIDPQSDTNIYTCEASLKNDGMKTRWTALLRVIYPDSGIPVVTPLNDESQLSLPPVLDSPTDQTSNSVTLSWSNSGQVKYWIEYVRFGSREGWVIYKKDYPDTKIVVTDLQPNSWYQFLVRSRNAKGLSRASVPTEYVKTLSRESSRSISKVDIKDQQMQSIFSQIQINFISLQPILFGKVKLEWKVNAPSREDMRYIEGFKIRYNMVPILRCLEDDNQAQLKKRKYCSFQGRTMDSIRHWIVQSDWWPVSFTSPLQYNLTSGVVNFKFPMSKNATIVKSIVTGLNPFSCYEFTVETYSEIPSVSSRESPPQSSLMFESIPSQPPQNIRVTWSKTRNTLTISYKLPPKISWNGFVIGVMVHIFANNSRSLVDTLRFKETLKIIDITNLDDKKSYSIHVSLYNCQGEGVRSPRIHVPPRTDEPSPYEQQAWFIPVIVVGTLIFWILLCCLVVYLCCIRFQLISKGPKFKSKDCEINLEPLMKDTMTRPNKIGIKPQPASNLYTSEALYSATSIINPNHLTTGSVTSGGTCTPYASASIVDSIENSSDVGTFTKFYTGSIIDELGPAPSTILPPYLTFAPHYTPYSISSSIIPFPMPQAPVDNNILSSSNSANIANHNTQAFTKDDNYPVGNGVQNPKYFNPPPVTNTNWPPSVKMGISQLPGSSSGTSSSGTTSQKKFGDHKNGSTNAISCSAISPATLGSATPSPSAIATTDSGGSATSYLGIGNKELKPGEESPKSTVHYDVIPNQETCDEFCEYSSPSSDSNEYGSDSEQPPLGIDTNNLPTSNQTAGQHSPGYSTDSVTYSAVPHRPYPKSSRKKQMRHYHTHGSSTTPGSAAGAFTNKSKL